MEYSFHVKRWWKTKRKKYNVSLIITGFLGFISYCIVGSIVVPSQDFEVTLFTTLFQGFGYLIMIGIANIIYSVVMHIDLLLNKGKENRNTRLHKIIYYGYFIISCLLPFSISVLLIIIHW